jgi:hypothetical protein
MATRPRSDAEEERRAAGKRLSETFAAIVSGLDPATRAKLRQALNGKDPADSASDLGEVLGHASGLILGELAAAFFIQHRWNRNLVPLGLPRLTYRQVLTIGALVFWTADRAGFGWRAGARGTRQLYDAVDRFKARA